jgi:outer membrane protein assembly factor BamB
VSDGPLLPNHPIVDETGVYIADGTHLMKFRPGTWEVLWRTRLPKEKYLCCVHNGVAVLCVNGLCSGFRTEDGYLLWQDSKAFEGCLQWRNVIMATSPLAIIDPQAGRISRTLWVSSDLIGLPSVWGDVVLGRRRGTGVVSAYDLSGDRLLWSRELIPSLAKALGGQPTAIECVGPDRILGSTRDQIVVSDPSGEIVWRRDIQLESRQPTMGPTSVFVLAAGRGQPARLVSLDLRTGATVFDTPQEDVGLLERPFRGTVWADSVTFGTDHGLIISFDSSSGEARWKFRHSSAMARPVFGRGWALASTGDGKLLVFDVGQGGADGLALDRVRGRSDDSYAQATDRTDR